MARDVKFRMEKKHGFGLASWPTMRTGLEELNLKRYIHPLERTLKSRKLFIKPSEVGIKDDLDRRFVRAETLKDVLLELGIPATVDQLEEAAYENYRNHFGRSPRSGGNTGS